MPSFAEERLNLDNEFKDPFLYYPPVYACASKVDSSPLAFLTKILCAFLISPLHATSPVHLILLYYPQSYLVKNTY